MSDIPTGHSHHSADQTELEKLLRKSKPWFEENATTLIYALAAVLAIAAVWVYVNRTPSGNVAASKDLLLAVSPEDFGDVADTYPGTDIGTWSRLRQADRLLDDAVTNLFKDRERGIEDLDRADAAYERLIAMPNLSGEIRERVLIGMARLAEARCNGNQETTDAAVAAWQRVLDEFSDSIVKDHAEDRIAKLPTEECKSFYKWFSEQNPKPELSSLAPGQPAVPEVPSITIPDLTGGQEAMPAEDSKEKPAEKDKADADNEKPAEEKPAEEKPAEEKPAEEKPAEEKNEADKKPVKEKNEADKKPVKEKNDADKKVEPTAAEKKPAEEKTEAAKPAVKESAKEKKPADAAKSEPKPAEKEKPQPKADAADAKDSDVAK